MTDTAAGDDRESGPERTPDGHHVIVNGRKWRATDPNIPDTLRQELVDELMAARRLVRTDPTNARPRVQDAKVALGERGYEWWTQPSPTQLEVRVTATIRALLRKRDGKTICPSDVARVVGGDGWRTLMPRVREIAYAMQDAGDVLVTQKGEPADASAKGPVRIAPASSNSSSESGGVTLKRSCRKLIPVCCHT